MCYKAFTFAGMLAIAGACRVTLAQNAAQITIGNRTVEQVERQMQQIRLETQAAVTELSAGQRTLFDFGAYLTLSYLSVDDPQGRNEGLRQYDLVTYGRVDLDNVHDFYIRGRTFYQDYNPGDSLDNQPDHLTGRIEEAYYRFDLQRYLAAYRGIESPNHATFTIGRQYTQWANGLVLAQYLDAGRADLSYGPFDLTLLGGVTASYTVDFDSSRPNFDNDTRRGFYGANLGAQVGKHHPYVYAIFQQDYNSDDPLQIGIIRTEYSYSSYYLGGGVNGSLSDNLLYKSELTFEGGTSLSRSFIPDTFQPVPQTQDSIQAGAADLELDYLLQDSHKTVLSAETIFATGDPDRLNSTNTFLGNKPGTNDMAFNAWGYINTSLAFAPQVSNLMALRLGMTTYPLPDSHLFRKLQFSPNIFFLGKFRSDAPIEEPTGDGRYLGFEPDLAVNWQIVEDVFITARYGVFFPGTIIENHDARQFVYFAVTYAF